MAQLVHQLIVLRVKPRFVSVSKFIGRMVPANWALESLGPDSWAPEKVDSWALGLNYPLPCPIVRGQSGPGAQPSALKM